MKKISGLTITVALSTILFFGAGVFMESSAWARAGGGGSAGSRSSRSFSTPSRPSPSPGLGDQSRSAIPGSPGRPSQGFFGGSPLMQGIAGGIAGGILGSMLFGGTGHAASGGGMGGSGIGLFEILILGLLAYFGYRFYKRRRAQFAGGGVFGEAVAYERTENPRGQEVFPGEYQVSREGYSSAGGVQRGFQQIRVSDPGFNETKLTEELEDLFFRIQASWTNRSLSGIEDKITGEMNEFFVNEFNSMNQSGISNHLENIAVRKVEPTEVWQETDKDYVTVLFTASLLDYTVDDKTGTVISGDKINPIKFREFWTFCREIGTRQWKLSAIDQMVEPK